MQQEWKGEESEEEVDGGGKCCSMETGEIGAGC